MEDVRLPTVQTEVFRNCTSALMASEGISEKEALQKLDLVGIQRNRSPAPDNHPAPRLPKMAIPQFIP